MAISGRDTHTRGPRLVLDLLERLSVTVAVVALGVISLTVSWQVFARYVTEASTAWAPELAQLSFVWLALMAIPLGVRHSRHMLLDVWSGVTRPSAKLVINSLAMGSVVAVCAVLTWFGIDTLSPAFNRTLPGLGVSAGWINLAVPCGFGLSLVFALETWWDALRRRELIDDASPDAI